MRKTPPIKIIVHYPQTRQGNQELAQRLADDHDDAVVSAINKLDCPPDVKIGTTNFCKKNKPHKISYGIEPSGNPIRLI